MRLTKADKYLLDPIVLIDGSPLLYINGNNPDYKTRIDDFMYDVSAMFKSRQYVGVIDSGTSFRCSIEPTYKAQRDKTSILEKQPFIYRVRDYLVEKYKFNLVTDIEGDDALAIMNRRFNKYFSVNIKGQECERLTYKTVIVSIDKDLLQLQGVHYNMKSYRTDLSSPTNASIFIDDKGKFYATSYKLLYAQMLIGDTADNIKGLKGYGQVAATKLLSPCSNEQECIDVIKEHYKKVYSAPTDD